MSLYVGRAQVGIGEHLINGINEWNTMRECIGVVCVLGGSRAGCCSC